MFDILVNYLSFRQILNLRFLNRETKTIVDNHSMWKNKLENITIDHKYFIRNKESLDIEEQISPFHLYFRIKQMTHKIRKQERICLSNYQRIIYSYSKGKHIFDINEVDRIVCFLKFVFEMKVIYIDKNKTVKYLWFNNLIRKRIERKEINKNVFNHVKDFMI